MSVEIEGLSDLIVAAEVAVWIGGIAFTLMAAFFLYLLVRPARRSRPALDPTDRAEMRELIDRIEGRMESLERIVSAERERSARPVASGNEFETTGEMPEVRRMK